MKPKSVLFHGTVLAAFLFLLTGLTRLRVNTDFLELLPRSDPEITRYLEAGKTQGFSAWYLVSVPMAADRFDPEPFAWAQATGRALAALPGVTAAAWFGREAENPDSLMAVIRAYEDLALESRLGDASPEALRADSLRLFLGYEAEVHADRHRWLLAPDPKVQVFALEVRGRHSPDSLGDALLDTLYPALEALGRHQMAAGEAKVAGPGVIGHAVNRTGAVQAAWIFAFTYLALFALLAVLLRSRRAIALALGSLLAAVLATHGAMGWLGLDLNVLTLTVATLVLILGIEDAIHITRHLSDTGGRDLWRVLKPCALVSLTTAAGFAALLFSDLPALRDFGLATTLGVALEFLISGYVYAALGKRIFAAPDSPTATPAGALPGEAGEDEAGRESRVGAFLLDRAGTIRRARWPLLILFLAGAGGMARLKVDNDFAAYYPKQHRSYRDMEWTEANLYRPLRIDMVLRPLQGDFRDADNLLAAREAERRLREGPERYRDVMSPLSGYGIAELKAFARGLRAETGDEADLADTADAADTSHTSEQAAVAAWRDSLPLSVGIGFKATSREMEAWIRGLDTLAFPGLSHRLSGSGLLLSRVVNALVRGQTANDVASFLIILSVLAFLPRRARLAFPALLANLFPIAIIFGMMGWLGISFDMTTSTVAGITAGIIVDNTIHLFWSIRRAEGRGGGARRELAQSLGAVTSTSLVLIGGFLVMACSGLRTFHLFGLLLAVGVAASWLCNILLFVPFMGSGISHSPAGRRPTQ